MTGAHWPERILILTPTLDGGDGVSVFARQVVRCCCRLSSDRPIPVSVWCYDATRTVAADLEGYDFSFRPAARGKARFARWGLQAALRSQRGTLVIVLHLALAPVALPLVSRGARVVLFLIGTEAWRPLGMLKRMALRRAWKVLAISRHTAARFQEANPRFAKREVNLCHPGSSLAPPGVPGHAQDFSGFALIVGRMDARERYKGHDTLLDLWPRVAAEVPGATLWVAGDGNDRLRLQDKTAGLNLNGSVRFLGQVSEESLAELYRDCAFFVMPSRKEGFGLVYVEAMQSGKACIGGQGAPEEIIENEVTGLIVDPCRSEQVLNAVVRLFREPDDAQHMGRAGAERVARLFTEQHFQKRFRSLLELESDEASPGNASAPYASPPPKKRKRRWLSRFLFVALVLTCLYLFRAPVLRSAAGYLALNEPVEATDGVLILRGDGRFDRAAQLYRAGAAPRILLIERLPLQIQKKGYQPLDEVVAQRSLASRGVSASAIEVIPGKARSDWDRARCLRAWLSRHPEQRMLVLCNRFESRRLRRIFDAVLDAEDARRVHFCPLPHSDYDENNWWQHREGIVEFFNAYVELAYVRLSGEDSEEWREWNPDEYEKTLR